MLIFSTQGAYDLSNNPAYARACGHQQYLAKNPDGYCGLGGTGVACPVNLFAPEKTFGDGASQ